MNVKEAASAQKFIDIKEVRNDTVFLKGGGLRKVLMVTGTNFEMKSEEEQQIILNTFQGFLNSLSFTLQIFIHSRKLNIDAYLVTLEERLGQETNELLRNQISEYRQFIKSFVEENAIMSKTYFLVIPFESSQLQGEGDASGALQKVMGIFSKQSQGAQASSAERSIEEKIEQLNQRVSQVVSGINQIGLRAVPLNNEELIELFYNLYNPATIEKAALEIAKPGAEPEAPPKAP